MFMLVGFPVDVSGDLSNVASRQRARPYLTGMRNSRIFSMPRASRYVTTLPFTNIFKLIFSGSEYVQSIMKSINESRVRRFVLRRTTRSFLENMAYVVSLHVSECQESYCSPMHSIFRL